MDTNAMQIGSLGYEGCADGSDGAVGTYPESEYSTDEWNSYEEINAIGNNGGYWQTKGKGKGERKGKGKGQGKAKPSGPPSQATADAELLANVPWGRKRRWATAGSNKPPKGAGAEGSEQEKSTKAKLTKINELIAATRAIDAKHVSQSMLDDRDALLATLRSEKPASQRLRDIDGAMVRQRAAAELHRKTLVEAQEKLDKAEAAIKQLQEDRTGVAADAAREGEAPGSSADFKAHFQANINAAALPPEVLQAVEAAFLDAANKTAPASSSGVNNPPGSGAPPNQSTNMDAEGVDDKVKFNAEFAKQYDAFVSEGGKRDADAYISELFAAAETMQSAKRHKAATDAGGVVAPGSHP